MALVQVVVVALARKLESAWEHAVPTGRLEEALMAYEVRLGLDNTCLLALLGMTLEAQIV